MCPGPGTGLHGGAGAPGARRPERPGGQPSLSSIGKALPACRGCELDQDATQAVMGEGPARAALVLLGEQPGDREDREGRLFVGPAGRGADDALLEVGIDRREVYLTNAVKHFRYKPGPRKRRMHESPSRVHVTACAPRLVAEMATVRPAGVVFLGATAGTALYGSAFRVGEVRGTLVDWPASIEVVPTPQWVLPPTHPSAVLRADDRDAVYAGLGSDLRVAADALG